MSPAPPARLHRLHAHRTHQGEFQGVEPTGDRIEVRGIQIGRFENAKIVERWGSSDELGIMQQIGGSPQQKGVLGRMADKLGS